MINTKLSDKILDIVNDELKKRNIEGYIPLFPMLRKQNDKLYYGVLIVGLNDNVWKSEPLTKATYWALIDINDLRVIEFNKVSEKDYVKAEVEITKEFLEKQKEFSKYEVNKTMQYKNYLMNDIKNDAMPLQKELLDILNNTIIIDGNEVNAEDYLMANIEEELQGKIKELIDFILQQKYSLISFYYECLIENIIEEYKNTNIINEDKMNVAIKIMNNYYDGVIGIREFFIA